MSEVFETKTKKSFDCLKGVEMGKKTIYRSILFNELFYARESKLNFRFEYFREENENKSFMFRERRAGVDVEVVVVIFVVQNYGEH